MYGCKSKVPNDYAQAHTSMFDSVEIVMLSITYVDSKIENIQQIGKFVDLYMTTISTLDP